jgi:hypothetical protein
MQQNFHHSLALDRDSIPAVYFAVMEQLRNYYEYLKILKATQKVNPSEGTKMQAGIWLAIPNVHYNSS